MTDDSLSLYDLKARTPERIKPIVGKMVPCPVCYHLVMAEQLNAAIDWHR